MRFGFFVATNMLLVLSGCGTVKSVPENYELTNISGKGLALLSLTYHGSYAGYAILYRQLGETRGTAVRMGSASSLIPPGMMDWDIEKPGLRGDVSAIELDEGDYEFYVWFVQSGYASISPAKHFSIKFGVTSGQASYVGNFHFERASGLGATMTGVNVSYNDQFDRDIEIINEKYKFIDASRISLGMPKPDLIENVGSGSSANLDIPIFVPVN